MGNFNFCGIHVLGEIYDANKEFHVSLSSVSENRYMYQINTVIMKISKYSRMEGIKSAIKEGKIDEIAGVCNMLLELVKSRDVENINHVLDKIYGYWKHLLL